MVDLRSPKAKARDKWMDTHAAERNVTTSGADHDQAQYLQNRLEQAWSDGYDAGLRCGFEAGVTCSDG